MPEEPVRPSSTSAADGNLLAAIDLGSNSFHLLIARRSIEGFETVERIKEKVQLLAGFDGCALHPDALARGEACLARFAQRLAGLAPSAIRVVGTHALREAADPAGFLDTAERLLGVHPEVISGEEEARLVHLGVARHVGALTGQPRLVVDIGGGSTEFAWSDDGPEAARVASRKVGCVSLRDWHFEAGRHQAEAFVAALSSARNALTDLPDAKGREVVGTSGTVESIQGVLAANGWGDEVIDRTGLDELTEAVLSGRWLVDAGLPGLAPERVDIFLPGLAVLNAVFEALGVRSMRYVDVSLQEGALYAAFDGQAGAGSPQARAIAALMRRFDVDRAQAARVRRTVLALFDGIDAGWWRDADRWRELLGWAAELHELGKAVDFRHYHRHGAYLLQNADLRAFTAPQQRQLSLLLRGHRRSFPGLAVRAWDEDTRHDLVRLLALLRIAVIVHRGHVDEGPPEPRAEGAQDGLTLTLPAGWLAGHALSARELEVEAGQLRSAGLELSVVEG
ncbi:MAG: exopolyphosphatase [Gammaproteobacteria bacterium]|nr:exopolyphosphatase [Gammaproteobacteria bacterium]